MRKSVCFLASFWITLAAAAPSRANDDFPRPAEMESQVRFWRHIFATYSRYQVLLHDAVDLDKVYKVLDFRSYLDDGMSPAEVEGIKKAAVEAEMDGLRQAFRHLAELASAGALERDLLSEDERRLYDLYADDPAADRFLEAASDRRLHSQAGLRERFEDGLRVSRRYLPHMEQIFRDEGLPVELTRIPLIESCFNVNAYSKVGAAGIWQFMPSTGRLFLDVGAHVDERRDPIEASRAAAQFLRQIHDRLDSWPLAITSWNHGPQGIARAVSEVGTTDIAAIVRDYHGPAFGFASRNFYAEFLAALDVDRFARAYFPDLQEEEPLRCDEHVLPRPVAFASVARAASCDVEELAELNPALMPGVVEGRQAVPAGYRLRLPSGRADEVRTMLVSLEEEEAARERAARRAALRAPHKKGHGRVIAVAKGGKAGRAGKVVRASAKPRVTRIRLDARGRGLRVQRAIRARRT